MPRTTTHHEQDPPRQPGGGQSPARPESHGGGWRQVLDALRAAGTEAGVNAADWWAQDTVGGRASGDTVATARIILAGIDDGAPAVGDALPTCDLSGRLADTPSEADPYADVYAEAAPDGAPGWDALDERARTEAIDAVADGYHSAAHDRAAEHCRTALPDDPAGADADRDDPQRRPPSR